MGKKRHNRGRPNKYLSDEDRKNDLMLEYYKGQFNWNDEDWELFYKTMKTELPATFRITGFREQSKEVQWLVKNKFLDGLIDNKNNEDESSIKKDSLAKALPWYPGEMAWQLNASKIEIRKTPELKKLHKFLISETDCGFISRQEAVSMLPPLLLDIEPHHKILDLCAAPGSKTAQLLEMLHAGTDGIPTGLVVANDIDSKRCYMMVHQLQRLQSPCIVVVRQDASIFPRMFVPNPDSKTGESPLVFDRILADVPCSGDGTLRKNQDLWPRWSPFLGINEHFLQMKILRRSLEMLAEGGRMVYSTCSLNPIEDEAVVATVLSQCGGAARLVDISDRLEGLIAQPGLTSWRVMLKDKTWCDSLDDVPTDQKRSLRSSLFPPADIDQLNIEYCRRILPYNQNTGGFFVALIEKVSCLPWMNANKGAYSAGSPPAAVVEANVGESQQMNSTPVVVEESQQTDAGSPPAAVVEETKPEQTPNGHETVVEKPTDRNEAAGGPPKKKARVFKEDPFFYIKEDDEAWTKLKEYYDIGDAFAHRQLMYRNADGKRRNYYFTNDLLKQLVEANLSRDINFVNLGVKVFGISEDKLFNGYRLLQEGVEIVEPFLGPLRRRLTISTRDDLLRLLTFDMPLITEFSPDMQHSFHGFNIGPVLFQYDPSCDGSRSDEMPRIPLKFAGWRGRSSVRHYVGIHERSHLLRLCGLEPIDVVAAARKPTIGTIYGEDEDDNNKSSEKSDSE